MILENETCKLEIIRNPNRKPEYSNHYYEVKLLSGTWPEESLVDICDNETFGGGVHHFGGSVTKNTSTASVTVWVD